MFYEHDDDYILLRIILKDVVGYYNVYRDKDNSEGDKGMSFNLDDELYDKINGVFDHIQK